MGRGPDSVGTQPPFTDGGLPARVDDTSSLTLTSGDVTVTRIGGSSEELDTVASERPTLHPGEIVGPFRIEHLLGTGGMGQVFAARRVQGSAEPDVGPVGQGIQAIGGELVALKYLERTRAGLLYRFKQEFRALAGVTHDNLVTLHELFVDPGQASFFTMELVDGVPFDEYVRGATPAGELPNLARLRRALRQLIAGVRRLHQAEWCSGPRRT